MSDTYYLPPFFPGGHGPLQNGVRNGEMVKLNKIIFKWQIIE